MEMYYKLLMKIKEGSSDYALTCCNTTTTTTTYRQYQYFWIEKQNSIRL